MLIIVLLATIHFKIKFTVQRHLRISLINGIQRIENNMNLSTYENNQI